MGYHIDEFLSWDKQSKLVATKLSSSNFAIARSKNTLPLAIRKTIYNSLFKSHLEYGLMAWGGAQLGKLKQVKVLQKKCIRNVANVGHRSHTDPLFKKLEILKLDDLYTLNLQCFMQKIDNEEVPDSFIGMFKRLTALGIRVDRHTPLDYGIDHPKNNFLSKFPTAKLPQAWNLLPLNTQALMKKEEFQNEIKFSMLSAYHTRINCNEITCPDCHPG